MASEDPKHCHSESDYPVNSRTLRIQMIDGAMIIGQINIDRAPGYERVSDMVTENSEPFLVMFQVRVHGENRVEPACFKTLFVNRQHILWAAPEEDQ